MAVGVVEEPETAGDLFNGDDKAMLGERADGRLTASDGSQGIVPEEGRCGVRMVVSPYFSPKAGALDIR